MSVPDYQSLMLPLLRFAYASKGEVSTTQAVEALARELGLSDEDLRELLPSGAQSTFTNRVGWASTYMKKAGLLEPTQRGYSRITQRGRDLLAENPSVINVKTLKRYPEFIEFQRAKPFSRPGGQPRKNDADTEPETPTEALEHAYASLSQELQSEVLAKLKKVSPGYFEQVVVDLLVKMGYGGSRRDAGAAVGRSGDGGIDGIIKEDRLGLDVVYIQAKRWDSAKVSRPNLMEFVGALSAQKANKGIYITTSSFTNDAINYVSNIGSKIVLIDGDSLAQLMVEHDIGVTVVSVYPVKKMDTDYFEETS